MQTIPKKVAAIHDLSCFGRCALTVIIPILSSMGLQCVPIPTALLSTHTGGFEGMSFHDLSSDMDGISEHFSRLGLKFDSVYSGFLGSEGQIDKVERFAADFSKKYAPILVDPVMGDDGVLYSTYTKSLCDGMRRLVKKADIITPNYTEACILTDTEYTCTENMSEDELCSHAYCLLDKLKLYGNKKTVMTGFDCGSFVYTFGEDENGRFEDKRPKLHSGYPGTGDVFASVLLSYLLCGDTLKSASEKACEFTSYTIEYTMGFNTPHREGVILEPCLHKLAKERN